MNLCEPGKDRLAEIRRAIDATGVWWTPSLNRWHDQTGVAHAVHDGGAMCGSKPYSTGGSFRTAEAAGARECRRCRRCRHIIDEVFPHE